MKTPNIQTTRVAVPQIYAYTTPEIARHNGWVKIGYTEQKNVEDRIKQQCHTANIAWILQWYGNAVYEGSNESFLDKAFHAYLNKLGYEQEPHTEWFHIGTDESRRLFLVKTEDIHPPKTGISVHFCVLSLMAMQK